MNLLNNSDIHHDKQIFEWGEISWLHEPVGASYCRISVAQVKIYPRCHQKRHFHLGEEQIVFVIQGQGIFITDGKKEIINKSMLIYIHPYSEHEVINLGQEDLVFIIVYVPTRSIQLEKPYVFPLCNNIQDVISTEVLQSIKEKLSELLKHQIHIYDENNQLLTNKTNEKEKIDFCKLCASVYDCSKRKYTAYSTNQFNDKIYKCDFGLIELEVPITINDKIMGYIRSDSFILSNNKKIDEKILKIEKKLNINHNIIWNMYKKIPSIIKSRIYVIHEHLTIAAQFIQELLERSILENELMEKEHEILTSEEEKIQLKNELQKVNYRIYYEKNFLENLNKAEKIMYPYKLEIILEDAIKELNTEKIERVINEYRSKYIDGENIVREMIIVLSRTALRSLENIEIISKMRMKYNKYIHQIKKEDPWDVLKCFCIDCIEEYKKIIQLNRKDLIDSINMYINTHYKEELNLNLVADAFYISPNYLSLLFNKKNNISFSSYIHNLRIKEAKRYLRTSNMKVCDIAKKVGYKNDSYFISVFKRSVGLTPVQYRNKYRNKEDNYL